MCVTKYDMHPKNNGMVLTLLRVLASKTERNFSGVWVVFLWCAVNFASTFFQVEAINIMWQLLCSMLLMHDDICPPWLMMVMLVLEILQKNCSWLMGNSTASIYYIMLWLWSKYLSVYVVSIHLFGFFFVWLSWIKWHKLAPAAERKTRLWMKRKKK